jgi:hypothetical protein
MEEESSEGGEDVGRAGAALLELLDDLGREDVQKEVLSE